MTTQPSDGQKARVLWPGPEQLLVLEGAVLVYCTSRELEPFLLQPSAMKEAATVSGGEIPRAHIQRRQVHLVFNWNVALPQVARHRGSNLQSV